MPDTLRKIGPNSSPFTLAKLDGRTKAAQLMRRTRAELIGHCGGNPDVIQSRLIDRACILTVRVAQLDAAILSGADMTTHAANYALAWNNSLRRTLVALGIKPRPGEGSRAPPSLEELFGDVA